MAVPAVAEEIGSVFVARFTTRCASCEEPIEPGDDARASGHGGWIHADCDPPEPVEVRTRRPDRPACTRCFMVPAANGVCGCDP